MPISAENAILTKSRAMLGKHLTKEDYNNLLNCRTVAEVASYLKKRTSYGKALENINESTVHRGQLETILRAKLFDNYASLCRYELTIGEAFSEFLIIKGEIEQLLNFLRLFMAGHPEEYILSLPVFFAKHSTIDLYELSKVRNKQDFFQAVGNSRFKKALAPYAANDSAFDFTGIEHALYEYMYMRMLSLIEKNTNGSEKREMTELIGVQIDLLNFAHIYRLKRYFDSNPDYIRSLVFPYSYRLSKATIEAMITAQRSDDVMDIFSQSRAYSKYLDRLNYAYVDDFVDIVKYEVAKKYIRFSINPSVVLMSYIIILESEIDDIVNIIEGVRYQIQPEEIATLIISHGHKKGGFRLAVVKMKLVSIIGKMNELDKVIEQCCSDGNFQLDQAMTFFSNSGKFAPINEDNPYSSLFGALKETLKSAKLERIKNIKDDILMNWDEIREYVGSFCSKLNTLQSEKEKIQADIEEQKNAKSQFEHFLGLGLNISELLSCKFIKVRFGRLPKESYEKLKSYTDNPYIIYFPCTNDARYVWGVYFSPIEEIAETDRIFASLYFERLKIPKAAGTPGEAIEEIDKKIKSLESRLAEIEKEIALMWETECYKCSKLYIYLKQRRNTFDLRRYAARYNDSFILAGWLPVTHEKEFRKKLDAVDGIEYEIEDASSEPLHTPPVKLKNRKAFKPFEFFVNMYGLPSYNEVDPTPFVAITYFLIFGMMFADLGQGIALSLIGWLFMWKMKKMPLGKIIGLCGISSAFFGFLLGSFFGFEHALDSIWGEIGAQFGVTFEHGKPIEVMRSTMEIIYAAVAFGVLLLVIAMLINIYSCVRRRDYGDAFFSPNGVAGLVFYCALLIGLVGQLFLGVKIMTPMYIILLIVVPLLLLSFYEPLSRLLEGEKDWLPKKWGEYLTQTFFEVFEYLLSYVSNTLSFMRIGAFVFVHAGMMQAVMMLAGVEDGSGLSVKSIIILIIGNLIVMGMEALLVAIQSLRLEFYEIFSRFFSGTGKAFSPININKTSSIK